MEHTMLKRIGVVIAGIPPVSHLTSFFHLGLHGSSDGTSGLEFVDISPKDPT